MLVLGRGALSYARGTCTPVHALSLSSHDAHEMMRVKLSSLFSLLSSLFYLLTSICSLLSALCSLLSDLFSHGPRLTPRLGSQPTPHTSYLTPHISQLMARLPRDVSCLTSHGSCLARRRGSHEMERVKGTGAERFAATASSTCTEVLKPSTIVKFSPTFHKCAGRATAM